MKRFGTAPVVIGRVWSLMIALTLVLSVLPAFADVAEAQETVSVTVTTTDVDGVTPVPFTRVRATSSDGTIYGPRETGLSGAVTFQIDLTSPEMTVTVDAETPPACGIAPDPQVLGPFAAGEAVGVNLIIGTETDCDLGTLAVYAYDCPAGFDSTVTQFETWRDTCTEERNNVEFTFTWVNNGQAWNPVTGQWGIPGRAPIVGLPPGAYTLEESNPASDQLSTFYCYTYATPDYVTSPNPTSIDRVEAPNGVATVNLDGNRISCDVFQTDAPADGEPSQPGTEPTIDEGSGQPSNTPVVVGSAITTTDLNLRDAPSGDSQILLQMPSGSEVGILGDPQNGFYPVRFQGQDGWASGDFLNLGGEIVEPTATTALEPTATETESAPPIAPVEPVGQAVTTSDVNFRDAPNTNGSNVLAVVPGGAQVDILGEPQNGFYPARFNGQDGWISGDFLQIGDQVGPADEPTATATLESLPSATAGATSTATAVAVPNPDNPVGTAVSNDSVNFRNGPSSEASVLFELPAAATVDILGDPLNGFYPVRYEGQTGWVSEIFLDIQVPTATATATTEVTATATSTAAPVGIAFTATDVNMRAAADLTSEVLEVLLPNTQVDVLGPEVNGFLPIRYNGQDGYASAQFFSLGAPATSTATATATVGAASEEPARLEFHKSVCPAGYDSAGPIFDDCHEEGLDNITFFVEGPNDYANQGQTVRNGGVGPGIVVFDELAPGT
ncbi:MAG: SH3 domain-containing protein, partial [Thermomicrobiales bacterium]